VSSQPPGPVLGKQVILTGGTNGIGLAAAMVLAARGANLAMVARDKQRGEDAADRVKHAGVAAGQAPVVDVLVADLSSQADTRRLAAEVVARYPAVHILVNNAGAVFAERQLTGDGVERTWALNHLAPFLLTTLLLERLTASAPARVITTSSDAGKHAHIPFDDLDGTGAYAKGGLVKGFGRYGETKLANIVFTMELARRTQGTGVSAFCYHPGLVATNFNRANGAFMRYSMTLMRPFSRRPAKGADTLVWLAESAEVAGRSGGYFFDRRQLDVPQGAQEPGVGPRLWDVSEAQVGVAAP
jgi:NAD(P)-dependent dehydrogenase (short-subunit alcohol dehydrogenase family)